MDGNRNNPNIDKTAQTRQIPVQKQAPATAARSDAPAVQSSSQTRQIPVQKQVSATAARPAAPAVQSSSQTREIPLQKQAPATVARSDAPAVQSSSQTREIPVQKQASATVARPAAPAVQSSSQTRQIPLQKQASATASPSVDVSSASKEASDLSKTRQVPAISDTAVVSPKKDSTDTKVMSTPVDEDIPVKKKRRKEKAESDDRSGNTIISIVKAVVYIVAVLVVSVTASLFIILVGNDMFAFVKSDDVVTVTVPDDADITDISAVLWENGIIKYPSIFEWYAEHNNDDGKFVAGTYEVACNQDYEDLLAGFKKQVVKGTSWITIPEGFTTDEIIDLFVESGLGTKEGYIDVINNYPYDYWFVHELDESDWKESGRYYRLDGYLFPDTYEFYNDSSEKTVIGKLLARFNVIYGKKYKEATETMGMTADQIVIIASMIEKEAVQASDHHLISSVFHNRLQSPYYPKLESDATALYAIHHDTGERPTDVTGVHMQYNSPYNTYLYDGLPPGPIANPSASTINAALTPETTDYYYFVSYANHTLYGRNNNEHEYNKAEIQKLKNQAAGNTQG